MSSPALLRTALSARLTAVSRNILTAVGLAEAMCAERITFDSLRIGWSIGIGSGSNTSSAAAPRLPFCKAPTSAALSTRSPRLTLMKIAPDFICAKVSALNMRRVCGVDGQWRVTRSLCFRSSFNDPAASAPALAISAAATTGSNNNTRHLNASKRRTTSRPIRPNPTTPTVRFLRLCMAANGTGNPHFPSRRCKAFGKTCRVAARMKASV